MEFLGPETGAAIAAEYGQADLVAANNVFAHVPDIRGFAAGLRALVKDSGLVTLEFPHLLRLIERRQYDTIYHEHYSYLSLLTASRALETAGLRVVDVEELGTHGGSLRVHAGPAEAAGEPSERVKAVLDAEEAAGLHTVAGHEGFAGEVLRIKSDLLELPLGAAAEGKTVAGYGAPGKGNTLLNHCGIRSDLLAYTVDRSPVKQGKFLPARTSRSTRPSASRRPSRTTSSCCRGTCGTRSASSWPTCGPGADVWSSRSPRSKFV